MKDKQLDGYEATMLSNNSLNVLQNPYDGLVDWKNKTQWIDSELNCKEVQLTDEE